MQDAAYYREWRAAHPEYRKREAERSRLRKQAGRGSRTEEYRRRREKEQASKRLLDGESGWLDDQHPVIDAARAAVKGLVSQDRRTVFYRPLYEDCVAEATLAILAGEDPQPAIKRFLKDERMWEHVTAPLLDAIVAGEVW